MKTDGSGRITTCVCVCVCHSECLRTSEIYRWKQRSSRMKIWACVFNYFLNEIIFLLFIAHVCVCVCVCARARARACMHMWRCTLLCAWCAARSYLSVVIICFNISAWKLYCTWLSDRWDMCHYFFGIKSVRVTLNSDAVCISISLFSNVLNCKKVGVCKILTYVPCNAVRIERESKRGGGICSKVRSCEL